MSATHELLPVSQRTKTILTVFGAVALVYTLSLFIGSTAKKR